MRGNHILFTPIRLVFTGEVLTAFWDLLPWISISFSSLKGRENLNHDPDNIYTLGCSKI